jgi:hypothetical protein
MEILSVWLSGIAELSFTGYAMLFCAHNYAVREGRRKKPEIFTLTCRKSERTLV